MRQPEGSPDRRSWFTRLGFTAYALVGMLAACGGGRTSGNATPTLILQPTPDRTVDAVVRGAVTRGPSRPGGTPGTPTPTVGTLAAPPGGVATNGYAVQPVVTPALAPIAPAH